MVSGHVIQLCNSPETVTAALSRTPDQSVSSVVKQLFKRKGSAVKEKAESPSADSGLGELDLAEKCGRFPHRPSDLFLKVYNDVLHTLDTDPLAGLVSPSLLGSSGVIPLSIVSVIPDIMRHYADLIVRAEKEIFLATNYWQPSLSARIVSDSLRELSKRVEARGSEKVIVKLMYDRGNLKQVWTNHVVVKPDGWSKVGLPTEDEIPGINLEVVNYHRPPLGTFHAKYLVVDRRVACLNSNNIQDRPNIEMMVHLEGPIVESFYDMALLSWSNAMHPPLPLLDKPPTYFGAYKFKQDNEGLKYIDPEMMSKATRGYLQEQHAVNEAQAAQVRPDTQEQPQRSDSMDSSAADQKRSKLIAGHPNMQIPSNGAPAINGQHEDLDSDRADQKRSEIMEKHPNTTVPSLEDSAKTNADAETRSQGPVGGDDNSDAQAVNTIDSSTYSATGAGSNPLAVDDHARGADAELAGTLQKDDTKITSTNGGGAAGIAEHLNIGRVKLEATVRDGDGSTLDNFCPHILHEPHGPVPIAMVNRNPTGTPGHNHVHKVPQDVAWLSALRYAQKSVFIQTPTFNASPVVPAALDACRRGVQVTLYLDLGFNDQGETIPFQGGTNEEVVHKMYTTLNSEGKGAEKHLEVFWYTGKDQTKPISAILKKRNCHVKFMSVDDQIAILGNGNQDTQSWFHSQEINIMVDSSELVNTWLRGIDANQNTRLFGRVSDQDGVWRSSDGEVVQASGMETSSLFGRLKALGGAIARLRGTGGF